MRPKAPRVGDKCGRQGVDKRKFMRPQEPRVGDKGETSVNSCGPRHPEWETRGRQVKTHAAQETQSGRQVSVGDKCKLMRPKAPRVGDTVETSVNSCGPGNPEWETSVRDKFGRQVAAQGTQSGRQGGDKSKLMRPKAPRVGDKAAQGTQSGRQVWETGVGDRCGRQVPKTPRVGDKGETSVNSCGPRNPEWETRRGQV